MLSFLFWCTSRIYYQYNVECLSTCTLTVHGLLHICDNIQFCGPVWTTWTFWMERYCGYLQAGLHSRSHPWANLNNRVLHKAHLNHIDIYYNLEDDLTIASKLKDLQRGEKVFNDCWFPILSYSMLHLTKASDQHSILWTPYQKSYILSNTLKSKISWYFSAVTGQKPATIRMWLPENLPSWGKVRIAGGGDQIHTAAGQNRLYRERNMSYVQVRLPIDQIISVYLSLKKKL